MELKGIHTFDQSQHEIWNALNDIETLVKITPGLHALEPIAEDRYKALVKLKLGPVSGSFNGDFEIVDKRPPEAFRLNVYQKSGIGDVNATCDIKIEPENTGTRVSFDGQAKVTGTLARIGNRLLGSVSRTLVKQFFESLEKELEPSTT